MSPEDKEVWLEERAGLIAEANDMDGETARALAEICWRNTYGRPVQAELFMPDA